MGYTVNQYEGYLILFLSIPFMGYNVKADNEYEKKFNFQFPLWDTPEPTDDPAKFVIFFQFPLWDTYFLSIFKIFTHFYFQFPLWDT